jgi:hypothetical protein
LRRASAAWSWSRRTGPYGSGSPAALGLYRSAGFSDDRVQKPLRSDPALRAFSLSLPL